MPFATDRDILAIEPNAFRDLAWLGQRLIKAIGDVSGTTLTLTSHDHDLEAVDARAGSVVLIAGIAHEILSRTDGTHAEISKIRADTDAPAIPPDAGTDLEVLIFTFAPQLAIVHREALRLAGIEPSDPAATPSEADITNPRALVPLEVFGALHIAYAAASALSGRDSHLAARASAYAALVSRERARARIALDLDGDGLPDAVRRLNAHQLIRA